MTHEYTILLGGVIRGGADGCEPATAIAWAADTVLAVGSDEAVLAISRGDSHAIALRGAVVAPPPAGGPLQAGSRADFSILDPSSRSAADGGGGAGVIAVVEGGRVVAGRLPA